MSRIKTINFEAHDQYAATNELLRNVGFTVNLDEFLIDHLVDVLRKQHPTAEVESIELLEIDGCNLGGMQQPESTVILADSLSVPVVVASIVTVEMQRLMLKLRVVIRVTGENGQYTRVKADVFVLEQKSL